MDPTSVPPAQAMSRAKLYPASLWGRLFNLRLIANRPAELARLDSSEAVSPKVVLFRPCITRQSLRRVPQILRRGASAFISLSEGLARETKMPPFL